MEVPSFWPDDIENVMFGSDAGAEWQQNERWLQKVPPTRQQQHEPEAEEESIALERDRPEDGLIQMDPRMVKGSSLYHR